MGRSGRMNFFLLQGRVFMGRRYRERLKRGPDVRTTHDTGERQSHLFTPSIGPF